MEFKRNIDPKHSLQIGMSTKAKEFKELSIFKGIEHFDFGESWLWKIIYNKRRIKRLLIRIQEGKPIKYPVFLHEKTDEIEKGDFVKFEGEIYRIPEITDSLLTRKEIDKM